MPLKPPLDPRTFPRPPALEKLSRHLQIKWHGAVIADTRDAYWVLETHHAPTYYLPRAALAPSVALARAPGSSSSFCEWKGRATYWDLTHPAAPPASSSASGGAGEASQQQQQQQQQQQPLGEGGHAPETTRAKVWSYEDPSERFRGIKGYLSFYVGPWSCWVDGEEARAQPGGFYGGWVTDEVVGTVKGGPGTWGW